MPTVPTGYHSAQPQLTFVNTPLAIDFYKRVFGATELTRVVIPNGEKVLHAEIQIGDSVIMLSDEYPDFAGDFTVILDRISPTTLNRTTGGVFLYVADVDATFNLAVRAGARSEVAPVKMYWGDRYASIIDPFGHRWSLATRVETVTPAEIVTRRAAYLVKVSERR